MTDTLFWNVDTQNDFMREEYYDFETMERQEGKLVVPGAEDIEPVLNALTNHAYQEDIRVVNTADWHNEETEEISYDEEELENDPTKFPEHCMQGTPGAEYIPATSVHDEETYRVDWQDDDIDPEAVEDNRNVVVYKDKFDVFAGNPHTEDVLDVLDPDEVVVYGVATDVCVDYAVNGLVDRGYEVTFVEDATAGLGDDEELTAVMQQWEERGAERTTWRKIVLGEDHPFSGDGHGERNRIYMDVLAHPQAAPTIDELQYVNPSMDDDTLQERLDELEQEYDILEHGELSETPDIGADYDATFYMLAGDWEEHKDLIGGADPEGIVGTYRAIWDNMKKPEWIEELEQIPRGGGDR